MVEMIQSRDYGHFTKNDEQRTVWKMIRIIKMSNFFKKDFVNIRNSHRQIHSYHFLII